MICTWQAYKNTLKLQNFMYVQGCTNVWCQNVIGRSYYFQHNYSSFFPCMEEFIIYGAPSGICQITVNFTSQSSILWPRYGTYFIHIYDAYNLYVARPFLKILRTSLSLCIYKIFICTFNYYFQLTDVCAVFSYCT